MVAGSVNQPPLQDRSVRPGLGEARRDDHHRPGIFAGGFADQGDYVLRSDSDHHKVDRTGDFPHGLETRAAGNGFTSRADRIERPCIPAAHDVRADGVADTARTGAGPDHGDRRRT